MMSKIIKLLFLGFIFFSCSTDKQYPKGTFGFDAQFVKKYTKPLILTNGKSAVLLSADWQGRVLTSSSNVLEGKSYGWINYNFIIRNEIVDGGNPYGGEDRFWLAPIGSKYSLYYNGKSLKDENWFIPKAIDSEKYNIIQQDEHSVTFQKELAIKNNIQTSFLIELTRKIQLFSSEEIEKKLQISISKNVKSVGFQSTNTIENIGENWIEEKGLIAPWVLGMFQGNEKAVAILPYKTNENNPLVVSEYLAKLVATKLKITNNAVIYKTDGNYRSKIGLKKENALPIFGSYNGASGVLTIITYSYNAEGNYLSTSEIEDGNQFEGDVVNSYNNASNEFGPSFYELESAAPAFNLKKGEKHTHVHVTYHFEGDVEALNKLSIQLLGVALNEADF